MKKRTRRKNHEVDSELELQFLQEWLHYYPSSKPVLQHKFHPSRAFRFDFAWPTKKIAVEIQGWGPGHNTHVAMTRDYDRHMEAMLLNWKIIFLTSLHLTKEKKKVATFSKIASLLELPPIHTQPPTTAYVPLRRRR